jgi:predicted dehydrogenase
VTTVPELVIPADVEEARDWRRGRRLSRARHPELPLSVALVTDGARLGTADVLRDAGVDVVGLLGPEPPESLVWAAEAGVPRAYSDFLALLSDQVEAICIEVSPPGSDKIALRAVEADMHVLLSRPDTADAEIPLDIAARADRAEVAHLVAFDSRAWPAAWHVRARADSFGRITQVTVLGAPAGQLGRTEILDLAARWCGEIVAVCADPAAMPARELAPGAPVTLALLAASGTTVLVNETPAGRIGTAQVTLCGTEARAVVSGRRTLRQDPNGVRELLLTDVPSDRPGLTEATYDLVRAAELGGRSDLVRGGTYYDLHTATRLLDAATQSEQAGGWVEL